MKRRRCGQEADALNSRKLCDECDLETCEDLWSTIEGMSRQEQGDDEIAYNDSIAMTEPEIEAPKIMEDSRWHDAFKESDGREGI